MATFLFIIFFQLVAQNKPLPKFIVESGYSYEGSIDVNETSACTHSKLWLGSSGLIVQGREDCILVSDPDIAIVGAFTLTYQSAQEKFSPRIVQYLFSNHESEAVKVIKTSYVGIDGGSYRDWSNLFGEGILSIVLIGSDRIVLSMPGVFFELKRA